MFTVGAVFIVEVHLPKVLEIANDADMFICNIDELKTFAGDKKENNYKDIFEKAMKNLKEKDRLFVVTDGNKGVLLLVNMIIKEEKLIIFCKVSQLL